MFLKNLIPFLALLASPLLISAFPTGAGTCDANASAISAGHGPSSQANSGGPDGFTISTQKNGNNIEVSINGPKDVEGFLLYAVDSKGNRFGTFSNLNSDTQTKSCGGNGNANTVTHKSKSEKKLPMAFTWNAGNGQTGQATFKSIVVQDKSDWNVLADYNFDVTSGSGSVSNSTSGSTNSTDTSSSSPSSSSSSSSSGYGSSASSMQPSSSVSFMYTTYGLLTVALVLKSMMFV